MLSSIIKGLIASGGGAIVTSLLPIVTGIVIDLKTVVVTTLAANLTNIIRKWVAPGQ